MTTLSTNRVPDRSPDPVSLPAVLSPLEQARQRLIVALDMPTFAEAISMADQLAEQSQWFKVGLELFIAAGPSIVETLVARGHSVFLDLKLHDIPNTVGAAVRSAAGLGARMLTIHGAGGPAMLQAAAQALQQSGTSLQLLTVTVLTSMDQAQLGATGIAENPAQQVERLARLGLTAGIQGFVCSPQEAALLRRLTGPEGVLVTPGIRPSGSDAGDQKRIATPTFALEQGASYLVVGRPITQAADPALAAEAILFEIAESLGIAPTE